MMTPEEETSVATLAAAYKRWEKLPPIPVTIPHAEAFALVLACQAMLTHPGVAPYIKEHLEHIGRQFHEAVADGPEVYALLETGWHREFDVIRPTMADEQEPNPATQTPYGLETRSRSPRMVDGPGCTPMAAPEAETRMEFWHRRGRQLYRMRKNELCALYRQLGGLGGIHPPETWTKEEVVNAVADMEWERLPDTAKKPAPEMMSPPCDTCGKGQDVSAHRHGGSHYYTVTGNPQPWVPAREPCAAHTPEPCGRPYEHHQTWNLKHEYQAPAEEQPPGAEATA